MTDLEKVELAARRIRTRYGANGTHDSDLIADAFEEFADEIARIIKDHKGEP